MRRVREVHADIHEQVKYQQTQNKENGVVVVLFFFFFEGLLALKTTKRAV